MKMTSTSTTDMQIIKLPEISTPGLLKLMRDVAAELEMRLSQPQTRLEHPIQQVVTVRVPPAHEQDFCLVVAEKLKSGDYIRASERNRVAEIAESFHDWVVQQGLPTTHNAGDWKRRGVFMSSPRAKPR